MKYIDELIKVSNNDELFKEELQKIKIKLENSTNVTKETTQFINDLNKYCIKQQKEFKNKDIYILPIDNYCMFVLNNAFNVIKNDIDLNQEVFKVCCQMNKIPKLFKDLYTESYISSIYEHVNLYLNEHEYNRFHKLENITFLKVFKHFITNFNLSIINDLIDIKPMIFIGENDCDRNRGLKELGVVSVMINSHVEPPNIMLLVNKLISDCMYVLFNVTFEEKDINYFLEKYNLEEIESLDRFIGEKIADYILKGIKSEVVEELLEIKKERNSIEYKVSKVNQKLWEHLG